MHRPFLRFLPLPDSVDPVVPPVDIAAVAVDAPASKEDSWCMLESEKEATGLGGGATGDKCGAKSLVVELVQESFGARG